MMDIIVKKLTSELVLDYLQFFDNVPHSTGKKEHRCYCVCWASTQGDPEECSTVEKRRRIAERYIHAGYLQGYLAYDKNIVVGWCNANTKSECYESISWKRSMNEVKKDDKKVKSVFCFTISPEYRKKGLTSILLKRICEDAERDGFERIEAYPNMEYINEEEDYMGVVSTYKKFGFSVDYIIGKKCVMVKELR